MDAPCSFCPPGCYHWLWVPHSFSGCRIPLAGPTFAATFCPPDPVWGRAAGGDEEDAVPGRRQLSGGDSMGTTVLPGRTRSQDTGEPLAQGAEFRMGTPFWRNTYVTTQYAYLHLLAFSNSFLPTFEVKADNPSWRRAFLPVKQDREEVKSRGSLFHL